MITIYHRVVAAITIIPDRDHLLAHCTAAISCGRLSTGNAMSAHAVHPPTVVCSRSIQVGRNVIGVGGERWTSTGTGVCVTHSVEKSFLAQCWWAPGVSSLQHWPGDISYQITLMAATSQWGKSSLAVVNGLIKNFNFIHQGALRSRSWSRSDRGVMSRSSITQMIPRAQPYFTYTLHTQFLKQSVTSEQRKKTIKNKSKLMQHSFSQKKYIRQQNNDCKASLCRKIWMDDTGKHSNVACNNCMSKWIYAHNFKASMTN